MIQVQKNWQGKWPVAMIDFYNQGTTNVRINGRLVPPNSGFAFPGFPNDEDQSVYQIVFDDTDDPDNNLCITTKEYLQ